MPAHPKPQPRAKKPGAMRSQPKKAPMSSNRAQGRAEKALDIARATKVPRATKKPKAIKDLKRAIQAVEKHIPASEMLTGTAILRRMQNDTGTTKTDLIISMLTRESGATSKQMEAATGWAPHSVRGLLGTLRKRGVKVIGTKEKGLATVYSIASEVVL